MKYSVNAMNDKNKTCSLSTYNCGCVTGYNYDDRCCGIGDEACSCNPDCSW